VDRTFGNLKVRPKLIVLHNLFFLVLATAAYFTLIPLFERLVQDAQTREVAIIQRVPQPNPNNQQAELANSRQRYETAVSRARLTLFLVLGAIYVLAVLALESAIMPLYVYRPLRKMLLADQATRDGDREQELIPQEDILEDEIGQIMRSRNETVAALRSREDELAAALQKLEEQDRLVSLGLLSASVAHELNTPLAVLNGSIEKLIETTHDTATLERLARMQRVTHRLRTISESLVDFARVRTQHMEPTGIRALIDEAWNLVAIDAKSAAVCFTNHVATEHRVIGNADRLLQVFVNLLKNSVNAIQTKGPEGGGQIEVRSRREIRAGRQTIVLTVEDNGQGIPEHVLPNVFDAFVTTRLDARGTGLGLTVSEGIINQHGGTITATNRAQGGAKLEVALPAAPDLKIAEPAD
jgi:signal transduction histidine kinase